MNTLLARSSDSSAWGSLPARMKVLYITTLHRTGGWLAEAFASDSASRVQLEEAVGVTAGLARLRDEVFDAVLVSHEPGVLDALELVEGLRAGGSDEPMIVLGSLPQQELTALCYEVGADGYCPIHSTPTRTLIWTVARAVEHHQLVRDHQRLVQAERQRLRQEHHEAQRLLQQQRALIDDLESLHESDADRPVSGAQTFAHDGRSVPVPEEAADAVPRSVSPAAVCPLPERLTDHYRELLRAYVVMGTGNLADELAQLAALLVSAGISARQTMQLHVHVLEELIQGLGNRSARHVFNRADLLVMEVMVHLAEGYRQRYAERIHPPTQKLLPGLE